MLRWRFRCYVSSSGRPEVQSDIDRLDPYGEAHFSREVEHLAVLLKEHWHEPAAKKLKGFKDLYEIRFKAHNRATRALGFFGPGPCQFTITMICYKKQDDYDPRDALKTADRRIQQIREGSATTAPLQIHGEDFPEDED